MEHSHINLHPRRPVLQARELGALADLYLEECALRLSSLTVDGYRYALSVFLSWWAEEGPRLDWNIERHDMDRLVAYLQSIKLSYNTRNVVLSRLRQLLRWAFRHEYIDRDFSYWIPKSFGRPLPRQALPLEQLTDLMRAAGRSAKPIRDRAVLALFIGTGIRRAEAAGLDIGDLVFDVSGSGSIAVRHAKGDRPRNVLFDNSAGGYLREYLLFEGRNRGPLFLGHGERRLGLKGIYNVVHNCAQRAALGEYINGPHDLRRLFATTWTRVHRGLGYAQPLSLQLGHTGQAQTLQYSLQDLDDVRDVFVSPLTVASENVTFSERR